MLETFSRELAEIERIVEMTDFVFTEHQLDSSVRNVVDLAMEEFFTNMIKYNKGTDADIEIELKPVGKGIQVSMTDFNVDRFDPTQAPDVDTNAPLDERTPGGLGIYLVMKMVDSVSYEYQNRASKITFSMGVKIV